MRRCDNFLPRVLGLTVLLAVNSVCRSGHAAGHGAAHTEAQGETAGASKIPPEGLSLGVLLGDPVATGVRYQLTDMVALQGWVGYTLQHDGFDAAIDGIFVLGGLVGNPRARFDLWFGVGGATGTVAGISGWHCHSSGNHYCHRNADPPGPYVALRVPVGVSARIAALPFEIFLEAAPSIRFTPTYGRQVDGYSNSGLDVDGGIGARYHL